MSTPLTLRAESGATTVGAGTLHRYSAGQRAARAVGFLAAFMVGALALAWVPVLHLIWVPVMLIVGLGMAGSAWLTREQLKSVSGLCPACDAPLTLDGGRFTGELHDSCPACDRIVRVALAPAGTS